MAEESNIRLYLCGHTHGGQICLPGGIPIFRRLKRGKKYFKGSWKHENMHGFTSSGIGTSSLSARLNCNAEIVIHHLLGSEPSC